MPRLSSRTIRGASLVSILSMAISVSICLWVVPLLGGTPDGPGFWMSVICPLLIAWPASAFQFHQTDIVRGAKEELAKAHKRLDELHSDLKDAHAELTLKSRMDGLTGILNRETFFSELEDAVKSGDACAMLVVDADHFKQINDRFGHAAGDDALRALSRAICSAIGPNDFCGRLGGEEFGVFLRSIDFPTASLVAEHIRIATHEHLISNDRVSEVLTVSIGGVHLEGSADAEVLVSEADKRLYAAKAAGRNCVVFQLLRELPKAAA